MRLAFIFQYLHTKRRRTGFQYHANRVNKVTIISKHYKRVRDHLSGFLKMERGERMPIFVMPTFRLLLHVRLLVVCFCVLRVNEYATNSNCAIPFVPHFIQNYINLKKTKYYAHSVRHSYLSQRSQFWKDSNAMGTISSFQGNLPGRNDEQEL